MIVETRGGRLKRSIGCFKLILHHCSLPPGSKAGQKYSTARGLQNEAPISSIPESLERENCEKAANCKTYVHVYLTSLATLLMLYNRVAKV